MLLTGFPILDRLINKDEIVEFYSEDYETISQFYHRVIVISSPVNVVIVSERGGLDPLLIKRFQRIFGRTDEIYIRRAFKAEDVKPTIEAMKGDLIVIDPFHHRKKYSDIVSAIRRIAGRKFIFSVMNRETEGSTFGLHSDHSVIKLERTKRGFKIKIIKSVTVGEIEIPFGTWEIYGKAEEGLTKWLV
ncbi:hypothetical protein [Candidatus Acidianus copahuensis]|uniref:Uncharacterized protein n=1 Tax=Candidatus Acidianus copahuensis TaxID=1160895 RepID=A0A031LSK9_9CREN|nr:hypothetical protein [Candidatus Acidianus copahuensis]EZQ11372.1 hypothetical protein CM19_01415 [Candidatus Acidianus copahuensis]NON61460.1 hypothetical protein [Acidianus sp. RZ1]